MTFNEWATDQELINSSQSIKSMGGIRMLGTLSRKLHSRYPRKE